MNMKNNKNDSGASEAIGAVLLISVVVMAVAVLGVTLISQPLPQQIPVLSTIISNQSQTVYVKHDGGDSLATGTYLIRINGENIDTSVITKTGSPDMWAIGDILTIAGTSVPSAVQIIYTGSGSPVIIASSALMGGGSSGPTPTATSTVTTSPTVTISPTPVSAPMFTSASTNTAGTIITITFDKAMASPAGKHGEFMYQVNGGTDQPFSAAALNAVPTGIDLTTSGTAIAYGDTVTVSYMKGTVTAADTGVLETFLHQPVTNNKAAPPAFVSAATNTSGTVITVTFDKAMADPAGRHGEFIYRINGGTAQSFSTAALNADPTKIDLTISGMAIVYGDTITISYTAGTVLAADTGVLASFSNQPVTNNKAAPAYVVETFTSLGTITWTAPAGVTSVEYLVVGGGGGGGGTSSYITAYGGGGGGAGGFRTASGYAVVPGNSYTITVGAGGNGGATGANPGTHGGNSVFATITSIGGGYGAGSDGDMNGGAGGSGGGGVRDGDGGARTSGQGYVGGDGYHRNNQPESYLSGGGGGSSQAGGDATATAAGRGGDGTVSLISGISVTYAGGGGGGSGYIYGGAAGGSGGGGAGGAYPTNNGADATGYGSGGGGGTSARSGGGATAGGNGSSGIVIIRYLLP